MGSIAQGLGTATKRDHYRGKFVSLVALQLAIPVAYDGDRANVDSGSGTDLIQYNWDANEGWVITAGSGGGGALPAGVVIHIGDYDATSDKLPGEVGAGAFVGTGAGGSIKKGNRWRINPASTTDGLYPQFTIATALQDNPTLPAHYDLKY